jgi:3-oxoacyl-[acyl-carrier protein] reductase
VSGAVDRQEVAGPAIVTGGGQGLGRAFCHALADRGVKVAVADINLATAQRVAHEIEQTGGRAIAVQVDIADAASVDAMAAAVGEAFGPPVVLVNNAAIFSSLKLQPFSEIPLEEWHRVIDVNVTGAFLCSRAVAPLMQERGYGKVINISSATVWTGRPGYLHYVTSKAALIGFTRALASELGPAGITVNAITPGSTATEVERDTISKEARDAMVAATAMRRIQMPRDVVGVLLFLASRDSDFVTGQTINVDGGYAFH